MWIRSQNKKVLMKATNIFYDSEENEVLHNEGNGNYTVLGKYSTKEKALKVLDMIQESLEPYKVVYDKEINVLPRNNEVFQMPQEDEV